MFAEILTFLVLCDASLNQDRNRPLCVSVLQFVHQMAALFSPLTLHSDITSVRRAADPAHRGLLGNKTHTQSRLRGLTCQ